MTLNFRKITCIPNLKKENSLLHLIQPLQTGGHTTTLEMDLAP